MPRKKKKDYKNSVGVIYARYSSHAQKDASIEQQIEECQKFAAGIGLRLVASYEDRAVSGRTDKRPNFQRMMRDAQQKKFQFVVSWKSNRIGRNMTEALANEAWLNKLDVQVLYVEEDFDDSAAGRFALRSMMNVNQFYSENMAEDIKRGMLDNARQCKVTNGHLPFGYRKTSDLRYEIDPEKAEIVREIFRRAAAGEGFADIARDLNARGIKTSRGGKWNRGSFHLLTNERYTGVYLYDEIRIENGIPRIISDELFWRVQEVLKVKKNPQGRGRHRVEGGYALTGKLFCGHCKSPMVGVSGTSKTGELHHYYVCRKKRMEHTCDKKNLRQEEIENAVARAIQVHINQPDVRKWICDSIVDFGKRQMEESEVPILETQLADTRRAISNIVDAIEQGIFTAATKDRLLKLEAEQAELEHKIAAARAELIPVDLEAVRDWFDILQKGDIYDSSYLAMLFNTFLVAVYVYDDTFKIIFTFSGDKNTVSVPLDKEKIESAEALADSAGSPSGTSGPPKR